MATHVLSMTYPPKIERVFKGEITQTIRRWWPGKPLKKVGDSLIIHTWEGKPYRSKWGKRLYATITHADIIALDTITDEELTALAELDGIEPPTAEELKRTLSKLNGGLVGGDYQVIRWMPLMTEETWIFSGIHRDAAILEETRQGRVE